MPRRRSIVLPSPRSTEHLDRAFDLPDGQPGRPHVTGTQVAGVGEAGLSQGELSAANTLCRRPAQVPAAATPQKTAPPFHPQRAQTPVVLEPRRAMRPYRQSEEAQRLTPGLQAEAARVADPQDSTEAETRRLQPLHPDSPSAPGPDSVKAMEASYSGGGAGGSGGAKGGSGFLYGNGLVGGAAGSE